MIKEFKEGHWYKWIGPKVRDSHWFWNPAGQMDFILDGLPHQCKSVCSDNPRLAAFYDSPAQDYLWDWSYIVDYFEEVAPSCETYSYDGKTYTLLRPITIKSLILDGARDVDTENLAAEYCGALTKEFPLSYAVEYCSDCSDKQKWMVEKGYWKVEEEERFECRIGDTFDYGYGERVLGIVGGDKVQFVNLYSKDFNDTIVVVKDPLHISKEEFTHLLSGLCGATIDEVYKTRIPYIKGGE